MSGVDMLALEQARSYLAGRYGEHDGWAGSIRDAIAAIQSAEAALLAKSDAYDALVAEIAGAPVGEVRDWYGTSLFVTAPEDADMFRQSIEGQRVRLLLAREGGDGS